MNSIIFTSQLAGVKNELRFAHSLYSLYINPVAITRTRKNKENPHYNFLYSWKPSEAGVKRESQLTDKTNSMKLPASKRAEIQAKDESLARTKKDIIKSLILVSFIIILELVVYLAWSKFVLS